MLLQTISFIQQNTAHETGTASTATQLTAANFNFESFVRVIEVNELLSCEEEKSHQIRTGKIRFEKEYRESVGKRRKINYRQRLNRRAIIL